jgi:hypothetical protein
LKMLKTMQIYQKCIFLGFHCFFAIFGFFWKIIKTWVKNWVATGTIVSLGGCILPTSFKCDYVITSFKSRSHVGDDKPRWRYEDIL